MEIGKSEQYLSFPIAKKYQAVCVIAESSNSQELLKSCKSYNDDNIILLSKKLSLHDLEQLGECEHFDIVLVYDLARYFDKEWQETINAVLKLGDHIIIEAPSIKKSNITTIEQYLTDNKETISAEKQQHTFGTLFLFTMNKRNLIRKWLYDPRIYPIGTYVVHSDFAIKQLIKKGDITPWYAGINLWTFKELQGIYPSPKTIKKMLEPLKYIKHPSLSIYNIIIQGKYLVPIDYNENKGYQKDLNKTVERIKNYFTN